MARPQAHRKQKAPSDSLTWGYVLAETEGDWKPVTERLSSVFRPFVGHAVGHRI